jgi:hypothetical protein
MTAAARTATDGSADAEVVERRPIASGDPAAAGLGADAGVGGYEYDGQGKPGPQHGVLGPTVGLAGHPAVDAGDPVALAEGVGRVPDAGDEHHGDRCDQQASHHEHGRHRGSPREQPPPAGELVGVAVDQPQGQRLVHEREGEGGCDQPGQQGGMVVGG